MSRICIAGLGNPGKKYEKTRHNIGFIALDYLAESAQGSFGLNWKEKNEAHISSWSFRDVEVVGVKPQSFMNLSGRPLQHIMKFYKIPPDHLIVIHDEIDLPFGSLRLKRGGGDAGHNGLKSISQCLGTRDYNRIRVGVGRPSDRSDGKKNMEVSDWVLSRFSDGELNELNQVLERIEGALRSYVTEGLESAQREFHGKKAK